MSAALSPTSASTEHGADEAGGESIFSSDGLPSLSAPLPPPMPPVGGGGGSGVIGGFGAGGGTGTWGGDDADVTGEGDAFIVAEEESAVDPRDAFQAFHNTIVSPRGADGPSVMSGGGWSAFSAAAHHQHAMPPVQFIGGEDPRRRLLRLQSELVDLLSSLATKEDGGGGTGDAEATSDGGDKAGEDNAALADTDGNVDLRAAAVELRSRLEDIGGVVGEDYGSEAMAAALRGRQEDLTALVRRQIDGVGAPPVKGEAEGGTAANDAGNAGGRIVYELYRPATSAGADAFSAAPRAAALEERLLRLERALGAEGASGAESNELGKSILERLEEAERFSKEVDEREVDKIAARAKVVRSDLEAAARAKAKLSANNPGGPTASDDAKTIASLHAQLVELDGVSSHLPALAARLSELSGLHVRAADFSNRLDAVEKVADRTEISLRSVEEALARVESGWQENADVMLWSLESLDELAAKAKS